MIRQCCICKRIENEGQWIQTEQANLEAQDITHGYCDDCFEVCKQEFYAYKRKQAVPAWRRRLGRMMVRAFSSSAHMHSTH